MGVVPRPSFASSSPPFLTQPYPCHPTPRHCINAQHRPPPFLPALQEGHFNCCTESSRSPTDFIPQFTLSQQPISPFPLTWLPLRGGVGTLGVGWFRGGEGCIFVEFGVFRVVVRMWTLVTPLFAQGCKGLQCSKNRLLGTGAVVLGSQARTSKCEPLVYVPLKDVEVVALQQLS